MNGVPSFTITVPVEACPDAQPLKSLIGVFVHITLTDESLVEPYDQTDFQEVWVRGIEDDGIFIEFCENGKEDDEYFVVPFIAIADIYYY
jgi:hypothetical protein